MVNFAHEEINISIVNEPSYIFKSNLNINPLNRKTYNKEYILGEGYHQQSIVGVTLHKNRQEIQSCIFSSEGFSSIHKNSFAVFKDDLFLAVGNRICSIKIPTLALQWDCKVDFSACFGMYLVESEKCLISHGEVDILRLGLNGDVIWGKSGKDIFSGDFQIIGNYIEVTDFNHETYQIRIADGAIKLK